MNSACEIKDKKAQKLALDSVVGSAPGFALPDLAERFLKIPADESDYRKHLENVVSEWALIDPAAVARFFDEHPNETDNGSHYELIRNWAAMDSEAAKNWIDSHDFAPDIAGEFLAGWYLNDRNAAVAFAVAHANDLVTTNALENILSALYLDSKEDGRKFIEQLPNDEARHRAFRTFQFKVNFGTAEETGEPELTPRAISDWMTQFPPAYWRGHLSEILEHWKEGEPQDVFAWIEQPPAAIRDSVVAEYKKPFNKPTAEAIEPILQIADASLRGQLLSAMFKHMERTLDEAKDSITSSSLSPPQKEYVLQIFDAVQAEKKSDQGSEK